VNLLLPNRHSRSITAPAERLELQGFGVELALKNTEYKAVDDSNLEKKGIFLKEILRTLANHLKKVKSQRKKPKKESDNPRVSTKLSLSMRMSKNILSG